jgi:hypothetical protein
MIKYKLKIFLHAHFSNDKFAHFSNKVKIKKE